ncbi:RNA polymerase sigma factor [uncultured Nitratireductor sp.]|uniref:RNA polymerase sigma factor n=1 Tax=uncultured Nitratireductor sp. TaxID=520953 RepID=UPI0025F291B7|nr:RNA polymerase sigma factor [uncultured Nitratireductor sp.]
MKSSFADDIVDLLPNLRRYAFVLCRSLDLADDLVQQTCEKAFASRGSYAQGTNLSAWLLRIMRNAWIDRVRRDKTRGESVDIVDRPDAIFTDGAHDTENHLLLGNVANALQELPEDQREIIMMICVEELSYKEAASTLGIPIGTVMSRLARARTSLAGKLDLN